jgi:hypothetical protein
VKDVRHKSDFFRGSHAREKYARFKYAPEVGKYYLISLPKENM